MCRVCLPGWSTGCCCSILLRRYEGRECGRVGGGKEAGNRLRDVSCDGLGWLGGGVSGYTAAACW